MNAKATTYLSLVYGALLVAQFIPLAHLLGAPFSFVMLAVFEPFFSAKWRFLVFLSLHLFSRYVLQLTSTLWLFDWNLTYFSLQMPVVSQNFVVFMTFSLIFSADYFILRAAEKIVKKSGVRNRISV